MQKISYIIPVFALLGILLLPGTNHAVTVTYSYDDSGRLVGASYSGQHIRYVYDEDGNLLARTLENGLGDINGDGQINIVDALLVARCAVKLSTCDTTQADVNCDHKLNIVDALLIARRSVGLPVPTWCK